MSIDDIVLTVAAQPSGTDIAQAALEKAESYGAIDPAVTKLLHRVLLIVVHGTAVVTIFEDWSTMLGYKKDGQIGAYHIALGIMIVFGVVIGTANWVLAILADWYEEQDLPKMFEKGMEGAKQKEFPNGKKPNPCCPLSKCCCVVMCITSVTGGNLQPLYERLRDIPESALQNFVAILSTIVLALPMALLQMSVALGEVQAYTNATNATGNATGVDEPEVEGFSSIALAMWAFALASAVWEKDQIRWWEVKDLGLFSPYFLLLCAFRLLETITRVVLLAAFAAIFGWAVTVGLLAGGISLVHGAKYLTSHYKRLFGRDAPLQSVEQWMSHAAARSKQVRDSEEGSVRKKEAEWAAFLSLNAFSSSTKKVLDLLPLTAKMHVVQYYKSKHNGSIKLGFASSFAKEKGASDSQKSQELLDYEQSRPRLPPADKEAVEFGCTPALVELHLRGATPLQASVYVMSLFPVDGVWFQDPQEVGLVPGISGALGLVFWYFLYLDLPIGDPFKYNVNPLFFFVARTTEAAVIVPLVLLNATERLLPLSLFGCAAFVGHLVVFPFLFHYARRFHLYAKADVESERYKDMFLLDSSVTRSDEEQGEEF